MVGPCAGVNGANQEVLGLQKIDKGLLKGTWIPIEKRLKISKLGGMIRFCSGGISLATHPRSDQKRELLGQKPSGS